MLKWIVQLSVKTKVFDWLECYFQRKYTLLDKKVCILLWPKKIHSEFTYMHINVMYI